MPVGRGFMLFNRIRPIMVTVTNSSGYFCTGNALNLIATLSISSATGTISFYVWTNNVSSTLIGTATVISGNATYNMSGNTLSPGNYYIQAVYSGDANYTATSSPSGTGGVLIEGISGDVTSLSTPILASYTPSGTFPGFCENNSIRLTSIVSSTHLPTPSEGVITFTGTYTPRFGSPVIINLGSVVPSSGLASLTISDPLSAFEGIDQVDWIITTTYAGNFCYANSGPSAGLTIFPTLNPINIQITSGSTSFCYTSAETYVVNVSSSVAGTAGGNIQLFLWYTPTGGSPQSQLLYNNNVSGSVGGSGFNTSIPLPADTFINASGIEGTVSDTYLQAIWDPNGGSCYATQNSPTYNIYVASFVTQAPTLTLGVSATNGSGYGSSVSIPTYGDSIYFRATFDKGGNPGSLTGANITITATGGYTSSPFSVTDGGNTFNVDFSISETSIGGQTGGTFTAQATSASNSCWNDGNSNTVTLHLPVEPPH